MRIDLGAKVRTKDGHNAGDVKQAIWDPRGNEITQYVVSTGGKHELDELPHYEPTVYTPPTADWRAPPVHGFPSGGYLWPVTDAETVPADASPTRRRRVAAARGHQPQAKGPKST